MSARPWGPDGALLCNSEATLFKQNFQYTRGDKTFEYGLSRASSRILEPVYAGFRFVRSDFPMNNAAANAMITG
jgi:hypothetical protein